MDSKPQATTYRWLFNSSETTFEIPSAESTMFFSNYKSSAEEGHGQVLCWASNSLGEQYNPCVFRVVPLGSPAPPRDCRVSKTRKSLRHSSCTITQRDKKFHEKFKIPSFPFKLENPKMNIAFHNPVFEFMKIRIFASETVSKLISVEF